MTFRIDNFSFANKNINLTKDQIFNSGNTFSLITGVNAVGKSRLLTSIIQSYLSHGKKYEMYKVDSILIDHPIGMPNKIIAITNSLSDKFPVKNNKSYLYEYFGNKSNGNIIYDKYSFIKKLILRNDINYKSICHTFYYLGFSPFLKINFKHTLKKSTLSLLDLEEIYEKNLSFIKNVDLNLNIENPSEKELLLLYSLRKIYYKKKTIKKSEFEIIYNIFFGNNYINFNKFSIEFFYNYESRACSLSIEELNILLENDILKITDVSLINDNKNKYFNIKNSEDDLIDFNILSSGQQALLNIFLSLSSCIENNSLICIDEPEISLHPEWQMDFIIKIQELFLEYTGCHFIIATHSPQIVSGLTSSNGFVVDLENNIAYSAEDHSKRSADFQLAKIFNTPGYNNEYILKICFHLLSTIKENKTPSQDDLYLLRDLQNFQKNLKNDDPSLYLIKQVQSFFG